MSHRRRRIPHVYAALAATVTLVATCPDALAQTPTPAARTATPTRSPFDPRRPPERELETRVPDGFTLAAVGDLITTRPLAQLLAVDPGFAAVIKLVREADVAYGNFE